MPTNQDEQSRHWHPIVHLAHGRRLYYYLIQANGELSEIEKQLLDTLRELKLYSSSCAYLVFGNFDFVIRIWADQHACDRFQRLLDEFHLKKEIKYWKKLFVSTLDTWTQRRVEGVIAHTGVDPLDLTDLWASAPESFPNLSLNTTGDAPDDKTLTRFFMFIEEPFDAEQKAFRVLRDQLANKSPAGLQTWSLYSYYTETEGFRGTTNERGVLFTGYIRSLSEHSQFLVDLPTELTKRVAESSAPASSAGADREHTFSSVTYICSRSIKTQEGQIDHSEGEIGLNRALDILSNLLSSHDNHGYRFKQNERRKRIQDRFIWMAAEIKPLDIWFISFFTNTPGWQDWWRTISDIRLIFKFLVFGRNSQVEQLLIRYYIKTEKVIVGLFGIKEIKESEKNALFQGLAEKLKHLTPEELVRTVYSKGLSAKKPTGPITLGETAQLLLGVADAPGLTDGDKGLLRDFSKHLSEFARHRNDCLHGNWKVLGAATVKATYEDYTWVQTVSNFLHVTLRLPIVVAICGKVKKVDPARFEVIRSIPVV